MKVLRSLNVAGNDLTPEGSCVLCAALSPLTSLRKLDVSYQAALAGSGVGAFAAGIKELKSLHTLMLISVGLDAAGALVLYFLVYPTNTPPMCAGKDYRDGAVVPFE